MSSNVFDAGVLMVCSCIMKREDYLYSETFRNISEALCSVEILPVWKEKFFHLPEVLCCVSKTHIIIL